MFLFFLQDAAGLTSTARQQLVVAGGNVRLNCTGAIDTLEHGGTRWERRTFSGSQKNLLSLHSNTEVEFRDRMFVISDHPGRYDLMINRTHPGDAGVYRCITMDESYVINTIELAMLGRLCRHIVSKSIDRLYDE